MRHLVRHALVLGSLLMVAGCSTTGDPLSPVDVQSTATAGGRVVAETRNGHHHGLTIVETALAVNADTGEFSTLIAALGAANLVDTLNHKKQFTVFAPTDAAFAAIGLDAGNVGDVPVEALTNILLHHVAHGRRAADAVAESDHIRMLSREFASVEVTDLGVFVDDAMIVRADVFASNGVIHVIDAVLMPGGSTDTGNTIVDVALAINAETGEFSTLIAALGAANLVDTLNDKKQFTVFAPTDAAFAAIGVDAGNVGDMPIEVLTNILLYHVAKGRRAASDVMESDQIRMLNREFTKIEVTDMGVFINGAMVIRTDVFADNGVIHVVDGVLIP